MARVKIVERKQPEAIEKHKVASKKKSKLIKKRKTASKKKAKEIVIVPRLRLEPTLKPKEKSKRTNENTIEQSNLTENDHNGSLEHAVLDEVNLPNVNNFELAETISSSTEKTSNNGLGRLKSPQKRFQGTRLWSDVELLNMATGLQSYGFRETKKIAELIKTKDENHVSLFIKSRSAEITNKKNSEKHPRGRPANSWFRVNSQHLPSWPNVRKWRRMAFDQMLALTRTKDYSRIVIADLLKRFYDEEEETSDPQVIDVKSIYKYLMDCLAGKLPPQLPPKESALVLDLLRDSRLLPLVYDFEEERKFLENYKESTRYKPFQVKDEFKKRLCKASLDVLHDRNFVSVPEEIFLNLSRHKKVVQSFNPLVIPVWMMQKEQEYLEKFI